MSVRVRIAPSPTGYLHIGTARTALYNYLFAKNMNGEFILRIEDTDIKRSSEEMIKIIIDSLNWLGLKYDKLYFQSKRFDIYKKYADELIKKGLCYFCYCTPDEIEERRQKFIAEKKAWKYDRRCFNLSESEKKKLENRPKAIRFFIPEGKVYFNDILHNKIEKDSADIEDFVIMKSDGSPSYNFACVVDDHEMQITHIIRGDDHITNTFKQILLYKAFGWEIPKFAHLPMILGPDRSKLSKRHGAISVLEYKKEGFLPEAIVNFIALLGWSPQTDREFFSLPELIQLFSIEKLNKTAAVFDIKKLEWLNKEWINKLSNEELLHRISEYKEFEDKDYLLKVIELLKPRMKKLTDLMEIGDYFFAPPQKYEDEGVKKYFSLPGAQKIIMLTKDRLYSLDNFSLENIELTIRSIANELNIKSAIVIHTVRLAITGKTWGPGLFHLIEVMGKDRVIKNLNYAINYLK